MIQVPQVFDEMGKYSEIKLTIGSGTISEINSHLVGYFKDFIGVFVGRHKVKREIKPSDNKDKNEILTLYINIEGVIFIFKNEYTDAKLERLLSRIVKYKAPLEVIGILSARKFSYPKMSLRDQALYMKANSFIQNMNDTESNNQILFGVFTHNETKENNIKMINFNSKFYYYSDKNKTFESLPYEVLSLKNTSYEKIIDFLPYNVTGHRLPENFGSDIILLKKVLMDQLESIDKVRMELSNLKISLKNETENNRTLIEQLREWGH